MIHFVLQVLVNALAVAITLALLPGIHVSPVGDEPIAVTYLSLGITLGFAYAILRPLAIIFTARLVVWSLGLFLFVINAFLFWLMGVIAPAAGSYDSPEWLWLILGSVTTLTLINVGEAVLAINSPIFEGNLRSKWYWRWLNRLPIGRRNWIIENLRFYFILRILASYSQEIMIGFTPLARFRLFMQRTIYGIPDLPGEKSLPAKVRVLLQDLGPTFVKFGQVVSSRADDLPPEWRTELAKLQSNVPPFPYDEARRIIMHDLKKPPEELYASIEQKPFAAASTAQVHRATLFDGTVVVVKVQRPDIDVTMKGDLNVMRDVVDVLQKRQESIRDLDVKGMLDDFANNILLELNYLNEMYNARQLAYNMREFQGIHVPAVYPELCCARVLTQEFVKGVKITAVDKLDAAGVDRKVVAREFLRAMLKQVLFDGFFHADPHPGNVLVDLETSQVIFLDMGLMGNMTQDQRLALADIIWSLHERDGQGLAESVVTLSTPYKEVNQRAFEQDIERMMKRYLMFDDAQMNLSGPIGDLTDAMQRAGLRLDPSLTLALKALFQAEEIVSTLDPQLPLIVVAFEELKALFRDQINATNVTQAVRTQATRAAKQIVRRLPSLASATGKWLEQYERGRLGVSLDISDLSPQIDRLDQTVTRNVTLLALSLLLAGLLVGSAIATNLQSEWGGIKLSNVAFFLFLGGAVIATVFGLRIVWSVWNSWSARK